MPKDSSPREVVEALMQGISDEKWQELHDLYSDEAVVEYPFALPATIRLNGLEAIRKYFAAVAALPVTLQTTLIKTLIYYEDETSPRDIIIVVGQVSARRIKPEQRTKILYERRERYSEATNP